ncbi:MAG: hypothetical protein ABII89_03140 [Candidatus Omnitrophota bacterium]
MMKVLRFCPTSPLLFEKKKDGSQVINPAALRRIVVGLAGVNIGTYRRWKSEMKAREQMAEEQPNKYPNKDEIPSNEVRRWMHGNKLKRAKGL